MTNQTREELLSIIAALDELAAKQKYNKIAYVFPDTGKYARSQYKKHMEFLSAGGKHLIRAFIAANRVGKSFLAAFETACHLTGLYPTWWDKLGGRKFNRPIKAWASAIETKQLRSSIQDLLFGSYNDQGSGLIPRDSLLDDKGNIQTWSMAGTANCVGVARVKHFTNGIHDGYSEIEFKTYEQGWMNFQGAKRDWIWLDEEPTDAKIYSECLTRTAGDEGDEGSLVCTFTPLHGYSEFLLGFLPEGNLPPNGVHPNNPDVKVVMATWDDCPHLSERIKQSLLAEYLKTDPNAVEARTKGIAAMGSGKVFPIDESFVYVSRFKIPNWWPKCYGLDPGWNATAAIWIAKDPETDVHYIYSEYQHGKVIDVVHAQAIKERGSWIPGGIDPHGAKHKRDDGQDKIDYFISLGLELVSATGDSSTLISKMLSMMQSGALKIFDDLPEIKRQIRTYRYDIKDPNKIAKDQNDHEIDAAKYALAVFDQIATSWADIEEEEQMRTEKDRRSETGRSDYTGY